MFYGWIAATITFIIIATFCSYIYHNNPDADFPDYYTHFSIRDIKENDFVFLRQDFELDPDSTVQYADDIPDTIDYDKLNPYVVEGFYKSPTNNRYYVRISGPFNIKLCVSIDSIQNILSRAA